MTNPQCIHIPDGSVVVSGELFDMACAAITERDQLFIEIERLQRMLWPHGIPEDPNSKRGSPPFPEAEAAGGGGNSPDVRPAPEPAESLTPVERLLVEWWSTDMEESRMTPCYCDKLREQIHKTEPDAEIIFVRCTPCEAQYLQSLGPPYEDFLPGDNWLLRYKKAADGPRQ